MKIADIRAIPLERRLDHTYEGGTYQIDSRYTLITEIELTGGLIAQTFGGDEERYQKDVAALINGVFRELLAGRNLFEVERHWDAMFRTGAHLHPNRGIHTLDLANKATLMQAIAAVDICLWEAIGCVTQKPLYQLLGGFRDRVPVIAIGGYYAEGKSERDLADELRHYQQMELTGIKLKVGKLSVRDDADRVRWAREVVGPEFVIACDANQAWTTDKAIQFCRAVQGQNVRWIEEPVVWDEQLHGLARVREQGGIPVNAGQGEISRSGCRDLIGAGAVDILNVDATIAGGITEWRRIAGMAACFGIGMAHHEEPQVALHLLASVPHGLYVEIFPDPRRDPMWSELPRHRPKIKAGFMSVPQGPGLGFPLNPEVIDRYRADPAPVLVSVLK